MTTATFQSFEETSDKGAVRHRIEALRRQMQAENLDGFVVPRADRHQSEYAPPADERLAWLTGFTGSAGTAVILKDKAALVVDGRYTIQSAEQTDTSLVTPVQLALQSAEDWIAANLAAGIRLGYDPMLHTPGQVKGLEAAAAKAGASLVAVSANPVDAVWNARPAPPAGTVVLHPLDWAGESAAAKLERVRARLKEARCDGLLVSDPHGLAWLFNIRGSDIAHTPLAFGYALVPVDGLATIFMGRGKIGPEVRAALENLAVVREEDALVPALETEGRAEKRLRFDRASVSHALVEAFRAAGGTVDLGEDPIALMKAVKNEAEKAGARAAHVRDGAAVANFLKWLSEEAPKGHLTEIDTVNALEAARVATGKLKNVSFPSISGAGPNAAIPHYRVSTASNRRLEPGIFLIDSGGQYEDGTTDITRTVAVGEPTAEMKDRFTRVLQGHIAISTAVFPKGTSGAQIDSFARRPLWEAGLDFDHGTGHGVGSYLSVHEGPARIAKTGTVPLEAGMILSNEPGYYKAGAFGIRIENLILVETRDIPGAEREMLGFEVLTFAPIDLALVEPSLLTADETAWLNDYHRQVREKIGPDLNAAGRAWLEEATRAI